MARATTWMTVLMMSAAALFADSQSARDPVEAPPPASPAAESAWFDGINLADAGEQIEELQRRIEAAQQRARDEIERLRRELETRDDASRLRREAEERQQERAREMREQFERARRMAQERARERERQFRERQQDQNRDNVDPRPGSTTRTIPVADLLATLPGRRDPVFQSQEDLLTVLKTLSGAEHWEREGEITINRRSLELQVTHRPEIVRQVHRQLNRFRQRAQGSLRITLRILIVPDNIQVVTAQDRAMLVSSEELVRIYEEHQGQVEESDSRDYERQHSLCGGDILCVWTAAETENDATYRGVSVVCDIEPPGNAVTIIPIPFAGDENKVNWQPITAAAGQSIVYELPTLNLPNGSRDDVRALAIITVDTISPATE